MTARIDLDLDESGLSSQFDEVTENWAGHREAILIALAENLVGHLKRNVSTSSGRLKGTIRALEVEGDMVPVGAGGDQGVDYTLASLHGSEPHGPGSPIQSENRTLSRWAHRVGYPGGFEGIYWHIFHYGTEGHDWLTPSVESYQRDSSGVAAQVLQNRGVFQ